jgi:glycosyltransferase involved in cell wall biosynthesis
LNKDDYELNIYGYGPLEDEIREYSSTVENILFGGRIDYDELLFKLSEADLLINPSLTDDPSMDFSFPSKLTEYILSERPVLTTRFSSLPSQYLSFVFLIEDETPEGIHDAIINVLNESEKVIKEKITHGVEYIKKFQNWNTISDKTIDFLKEL